MLGINANYRIASDGRQYIIQKKIYVTNKETQEKEEAWISECFPSTLEYSLHWLVDKHIKTTVANEDNIKTIIKSMQDVLNDVKELKTLAELEHSLKSIVTEITENCED